MKPIVNSNNILIFDDENINKNIKIRTNYGKQKNNQTRH